MKETGLSENRKILLTFNDLYSHKQNLLWQTAAKWGVAIFAAVFVVVVVVVGSTEGRNEPSLKTAAKEAEWGGEDCLEKIRGLRLF